MNAILRKVYGWPPQPRRTPDVRGRGHVWIFYRWRLREEHSPLEVMQALWECEACGLVGTVDFIWKVNVKVEPVPGSSFVDRGGLARCTDRQVEQAVWLLHDDRHPNA